MTIYLDNAATSFPKPESVYGAVENAMRRMGNPGRGGHRMSLDAGRILFEVREAAAEFFGVSDSSRIAFTSNATEAINVALFGLLQPGDRVVTSAMEHNAVSRPLRTLQDRGVQVVKVPADRRGAVDPAAVREACRERTRMVVLSHCSNVTGTLQEIESIGPWCRREGILFLVDAAQSAGLFNIQVDPMGIDLLAVPGHKGLMGPAGTGLLYVREGVEITPLIFGGTGGRSHSDLPPEQMPERLEAGTLNLPGLAGLGAAFAFLKEEGAEAIAARQHERMGQLLRGLKQIKRVDLYGRGEPRFHGEALSFNLQERDPSEVGFLLEQDHGIAVRTGLHCAPDAHRTIGTWPRGTVRVSPGYFTTGEEIDHFLAAVAALASHPTA